MYQGTYTLATFREPSRNSDKFYRGYYLYDTDAGDHRVLFNWGRNGVTGQFQVLVVNNEREALNAIDAKLGSKYAKGYVETGSGHLAKISEDLLNAAGVNVRSQPVKEEKLSLVDQITVNAERAVRLLTGPAELQVEAVTLAKGLHDTLALLRREVSSAEGRIDLVDMLLSAKVG